MHFVLLHTELNKLRSIVGPIFLAQYFELDFLIRIFSHRFFLTRNFQKNRNFEKNYVLKKFVKILFFLEEEP